MCVSCVCGVDISSEEYDGCVCLVKGVRVGSIMGEGGMAVYV